MLSPGRLARRHGVTAPAGFKASEVDGVVAVLVNEGPDLTAAGVFTGERPTAGMLWTKQVLTAGRLRAVLLHAGTPSAELSDDFGWTHHAAEEVAGTLSHWGTGTGAGEVAVLATGGPAPAGMIDTVADAVRELAGGLTGGYQAARAAAGPGSAPAQAAVQHEDGWTVGAMSAASGSVCVLTTDAVADAALLLGVLNTQHGTERSTLLLASGASESACGAEELAGAVASVREDLYARGGARA